MSAVPATRFVGGAFIALSIVCSAGGQLGMKLGMQKLHDARALAGSAWLDPIFWPAALWTAAGLASYVLSLAAWLVVLTRYPLSYAYPLLGLTYVIVYVGATQLPSLLEPATTLRTLGTLLIVAGAALVAATDDR
jgi:multidrug transporter EmrE-like cation transporter